MQFSRISVPNTPPNNSISFQSLYKARHSIYALPISQDVIGDLRPVKQEKSFALVTEISYDYAGYRKGINYGKKCKAKIQGLDDFVRKIDNFMKRAGYDIDELMKSYKKYIPDFLWEEMEGVAIGAEVSFKHIFIENFFIGLLK